MDKEYEVQKALGLLKTFVCTVLYTNPYANGSYSLSGPNGPEIIREFKDILIESYGPGEHLEAAAKEWLYDQNKWYCYYGVTIDREAKFESK